mmetsp:Transcript_1136/g.2789  ORF Transcript_1136/g.2789 Transcript_1136/m.2789 type:complete len:218 (-) Transcript_1136:315-968(-)
MYRAGRPVTAHTSFFLAGGADPPKAAGMVAGSVHVMVLPSLVDRYCTRGPVSCTLCHTTFFMSSSMRTSRRRSFSFSTAVSFASSSSSSCVYRLSSDTGLLFAVSCLCFAASVAAIWLISLLCFVELLNALSPLIVPASPPADFLGAFWGRCLPPSDPSLSSSSILMARCALLAGSMYAPFLDAFFRSAFSWSFTSFSFSSSSSSSASSSVTKSLST